MIIREFFRDESKKVSLTAYILSAETDLGGNGFRPAVLVCPGGGYRCCSNREAEPIATAFLSEGFHAFVLRYSINDDAEFPRPLNDAEWAMDIIRENADDFGIDEVKIAVCGFSAGGHLAAALGTMGRVRPAAMILGYPCIMDNLGKVLQFPIPSLEKEVDEKTPPCYIFTTRDDATVPVSHSIEFASALDRAGKPFEMHIFGSGRHGLSRAKPLTACGRDEMVNPIVAQWVPMCIDWLNALFEIN